MRPLGLRKKMQEQGSASGLAPRQWRKRSGPRNSAAQTLAPLAQEKIDARLQLWQRAAFGCHPLAAHNNYHHKDDKDDSKNNPDVSWRYQTLTHQAPAFFRYGVREERRYKFPEQLPASYRKSQPEQLNSTTLASALESRKQPASYS
jgi:hypothetical protein